MTIHRLRASAYMGIEEIDIDIAPSGVIIEGGNGKAKTSIVHALRAALVAKGIGPDAIRLGADRAEILVDINDLSVRRVITQRNTQLTVTKEIGGIVAKLPEPTTFLRALLGTSALDPIDLLTEKDKQKRRAKILAALPTSVTAEQLSTWTEGECTEVPTNATGLEAVSQVRKAFYDRRTAQNAKAKESRKAANDLKAEMQKLPDRIPDAMTAEAVRKAQADAERTLAELETRAKAAREAEERTKASRARVEELRRSATMATDGLTEPPADDVVNAEKSVREWTDAVQTLEAELAQAKLTLAQSELVLKTRQARAEHYRAAVRRAEEYTQQAADLEAVISATTTEAPTEKEMTVAQACVQNWAIELQNATEREANDVLRQRAFDAEQAAKANEAEAARLDGIVNRLTHDAPAELLASSGVHGLTDDGTDIRLDGVALDSLCGQEQLKFCIEISRRTNGSSKLLIVDGIERIARDQLDDFVKLCTRDGYQLIATRVTEGPRTIQPIQPEEATT